MKILGIDPGLVQTGFGIINIKNNQAALIDYGIIKPKPKEQLAQRLLTIFQDVCQVVEDYEPVVVAIEDVFYGMLLLLFNIMIYEKLRKVFFKSPSKNESP